MTPIEQWAKEQWAKLPERVQDLIDLANYDLYFGPIEDEEEVGWPGFSKACDEIGKAINGLVQDVWVDNEAGIVLTEEPTGYTDEEGEWVEPIWEDYTLVSAQAVKQLLVGKDLARHV